MSDKDLKTEEGVDHALAVLDPRPVTVIEKVSALTFQTDEDLERARDLAKEAKEAEKRLKDIFDPFVKARHEAHKRATQKKKEHILPLEQATKDLKDKIAAYLTEREERLRKEAEERERKEAADRARRLAAIETQISRASERAASHQERLDALRTLRDEAKTEEEAERLEAEITATEARLNQAQQQIGDKATRAEEVASTPGPASQAPPPPKTSGLSLGKDHEFEVVNPAALCKAIGEGKVPASVVGNWSTSSMKALHKAGVPLPGVRITTKPKVGVR